MTVMPWRGCRRPLDPDGAALESFCRSSILVGDRTFVLSSDPTRVGLAGASPLGKDAPRQAGAAPSALPDTTLRPMMTLGPFRLLQRLGQGAQGEVWKARRAGAGGRFVALKILNPDLTRSPNRLAQFRHEAERGARLAGPALLRVIEFGQIDRFLYMAMPLIEGTTLQQIIRNRKTHLAGERAEPVHRLVFANEARYLHAAIRILAVAARALGQIHSGLVVHRDIKPANILVDSHRDCGVYLCDLGLGRDLEQATPQQMRDGAGTPMYMAPERLLKAPADEMLCDIYSLGVTLFETVTLERPFLPPEGLPSGCLSVYLATSLPRSARSLKPDLPAAINEVIVRAMSRDPHQRHRSAEDFAADLERISATLGAATPGVFGHPGHPARQVPHRLPLSRRAWSDTGRAS